MQLAIALLATDWHTLHKPGPPPILLPNVRPPLTEAQRSDCDQEDSADRRSNGNEDRLVLGEPAGDTAIIIIALPDIWRARGCEGIQEHLICG